MLSFGNVLAIACATSFLIAGGEAAGQRKYPHYQQEYNSELNNEGYVGYRAAALQYHSFDDITGGGFAALEVNAIEYIKYIEEASAQGAQIIVFPEHGLTGLTLGSTLDEYLPQTQVVPDPEGQEVPCDYMYVPESSKIIQQLSCAARENQIYLVVCLAEQFNCSQSLLDDDLYLKQTIDASAMPDGCEFYDTQVVFDDNGAIIARYRKKHLFVEDHFTEGTDPDSSAVFETSFGVTFTLMISFDLLYYDPAISNMESLGVRDVITSAGWMDQLPFLVAPQIWKGFSEGYQANLIAANHYNPLEGFLGAGIFRGVAKDPESYTYDTSSGTKLIIGDVVTQPQNFTKSKGNNKVSESFRPFKGSRQSTLKDQHVVTTGKNRNCHEKRTEFNMFQKYKHENLDDYIYALLIETESDVPIRRTLYHNDTDLFICGVTYSYPRGGSDDFVYMLISYQGLTEHANSTYFVYNQNCAVVLCLNVSISTCGHIEGATLGDSSFRASSLDALFSDHYIYPSILTDSMQLFDSTKWNYTIVPQDDQYNATITIDEEVNDVLTLGMYSRVFSRDPDVMP